jgi:Peptidase inhibitor family I36
MRFRFTHIVVLLLLATSLPAFAQWQWGRPRAPRAGACFYKDNNFRGAYFCLKAGERWPALPSGFNDKISSIRVFGGARLRLFSDTNFGGATVLLDTEVGDLHAVPLPPRRNWNDRVSAIAVFTPDHDEWRERHDHDDDRHDRDGDRHDDGDRR